ncbi:hypothetical protein Poly30_08900 [Planctomycetes bacterium Poly30]|uniref:DUF429 domain-containing protein n=1 Tax=Saltatorellus ferox TaxID=2528018 RepID=A0A518EMS8_9BACT|nr:hypothetical protein Poly30_08900 [Planctomycetes bacterium Poly30]
MSAPEGHAVPSEEFAFVGVDGTRGRWISIALGPCGAFRTAILTDTLAEILDAFPHARAIGIDVPIGVPERISRTIEAEAKKRLAARSSTVFSVPPRVVLEAPTYAAARALAVELTGKSLSAQSYALRHNILEADRLLDARPRGVTDRVFEVHPELSFRALADRVLLSNKRSWNGAMERRQLLSDAGIDLPLDLGDAGKIPVDDVLDAAVAAWSAKRIAEGRANSVPSAPELDARGRPMAMWF